MPLLLAAVLQALPPCELPDLDVPGNAWSGDFQTQALADGALGVAMSDPMADDNARLSGIPADSPPTAAHSKNSRWLWSEASDWLLVPNALDVAVAGVGVDGSWIIELKDSANPDRRLRFSSTGACVGCAYGDAAPLFYSYAKQARENEFEFCKGLSHPIVRDESSATRLRYHYDNPRGRRHDAVAVIGDDEVYFFQAVAGGLDQALTYEILGAIK